MKKENNKGITLIALIVTIIVLVLIAGVTIAALTSDNGIIRQTNTAKVDQIEGTAREQVKLGVSAMRLAIAEASSKDNSYRADNNTGKIQAKLVEILNNDKSGLNGEFGFGGNDLADNATGTELKVNYTGDDYQNACNDENADIIYTITLGQKIIEITDETSWELKDQNQNDATIDVGVNTPHLIAPGEYLVNQVEIGDYIDIGINYGRITSVFPEYLEKDTYSSSGITGWRVLSKEGNGESGTVTLVTGGMPMCYDTDIVDVALFLEEMTNLNRKFTKVSVTSGTGFWCSAFENSTFDLKSLWATNSKINAETAHALTTEEIEIAYKTITGTEKTMIDLENEENALQTSVIKNYMESNNLSMSTKAYDLLGTGYYYNPAGSLYQSMPRVAWWIYPKGAVNGLNKPTGYSIRIVLSLYPGVRIAEDNTGTGDDEDKAYTLAD